MFTRTVAQSKPKARLHLEVRHNKTDVIRTNTRTPPLDSALDTSRSPVLVCVQFSFLLVRVPAALSSPEQKRQRLKAPLCLPPRRDESAAIISVLARRYIRVPCPHVPRAFFIPQSAFNDGLHMTFETRHSRNYIVRAGTTAACSCASRTQPQSRPIGGSTIP